jgi:two-component system chemotaxis sensor kinase CheA
MFSGNTILGDGSVIMILDPNGIAAATGEITVSESAVRADSASARASARDDVTSLLLFRAGKGAPKAVPLALVARLEEIDLAQIEYSHDKPVVQYRGKLMPLVTVEAAVSIGTSGRQPVLVFADKDHTMGLMVDEIVDIVEDHLNIEVAVDRAGLIGSAIIAGKATDLIDAGYYLTQAFTDWFGARSDGEFQSDKGRRVLLVDDSPFFRNLLTPLLSVAGYDVTTVESGDRALSLCEAGADFDVIISDIEMPGMNGFEFATAVKQASRWQNTPIVALSSHATPRDLDRGRAAGFNDYVAKFDREALLHTLAETLNGERGAA